MSNFNFYQFLEANGYQREKIRDRNGRFFANNYQKELSDQVWNCITIHEDKTMSAASPKNGLFAIRQPQPTTEQEAINILKQAEEL